MGDWEKMAEEDPVGAVEEARIYIAMAAALEASRPLAMKMLRDAEVRLESLEAKINP